MGKRRAQVSEEDLRHRGVILILAGVLVGVGMSYVLGGPASASSLVAMASIQPFHLLGGMVAWGALLVLAGALLATGQRTLGHGLATLVLLVWAGCSLVVLIDGTSTGASGPVTMGGWAVLHGWCLYSHRLTRRGSRSA
jgi:hypothetical protein